jgi:hypothetical protein
MDARACGRMRSQSIVSRLTCRSSVHVAKKCEAHGSSVPSALPAHPPHNMPLFDSTNRLSADNGAVQVREGSSAAVSDYVLSCMRGCTGDYQLLQYQYRNLWSWDGFGMSTRHVDKDSALRGAEVTHPRQRIQLPKRVFQAVPNLAHGRASPVLESRLQSGLDTSGVRACERLAEVDFGRFDPGVHAVGAEHIIPKWTNGGAPSRSIARSGKFLESQGFEHDGRIWRRPQAN